MKQNVRLCIKALKSGKHTVVVLVRQKVKRISNLNNTFIILMRVRIKIVMYAYVNLIVYAGKPSTSLDPGTRPRRYRQL